MSEVHILAGNIGTGKSTTVSEIIKDWKPATFYVVSEDDIIILMNHGYHGSEVYEVDWKPVVWEFKLNLVGFCVKSNLNVVLDDCHMEKAQRVEIVQKARTAGNARIIVHWHEFSDGYKRRIKSDPRGQSLGVWEQVHDMYAEEEEFPEEYEGMDELVIWDGLGKVTTHAVYS